MSVMGFPGGLAVKNPPEMQEMWVQSLGGEDAQEKEMATHSTILAWEILWTEEPGGLQSMRLQESDMTERLNYHHQLFVLPEDSLARLPRNQSPQLKGCLWLCPPSYRGCRDLTGRDTETTRDGQNQPEQGSVAGQPIVKIQQWQ